MVKLMPIPQPKSGESEEDFHSRCMHEMNTNPSLKEEFKTQDQRNAVCYSAYREAHKKILGREFIVPILRSFEKDGERYVYGYGAIFDSPDELGTIITPTLVDENIPRLRRNPSLRFMHQSPLGRIQFDKTIELDDGTFVSTKSDEHGFHILAKVFKACEKEWSMIQEGGWGLSYALSPRGLVVGRKDINGKSYESFEHGTLYEFSVVDSPAHTGAQAGAIVRILSDQSYIYGGDDVTNEENRYVAEGDLPKKLGTGGYACKVGDEFKLPIHDEAHVRNAMARYNQAEGCQTSEVKARICAAAKHFGISGAFEKGGFCYKGEERKMDKDEMEALEKQITENVVKAIEGKKSEFDAEKFAKDMETRIMGVVNAKIEELKPKPEPSKLDKTVEGVKTRIVGMESKIKTLRESADKLKGMGENVENIEQRITQLEKERDDLQKSVVDAVSKEVQRYVKGIEDRLSAIEDIPDLHSPASIGSGVSVVRGFGEGIKGMMGAAFGEGEQQ